MAALRRKHEDKAERRQQPVGHRVFRKEPQPRRQTYGDPPTPPPLFACSDKRVERCSPEEHERSVGRYDERGDRDARQARVGERRPEPDALVIEPRADAIHKERRAGVEERSRQPNCKLAVAEKPGRCSDQPGDQRRLRVVTESELLRPDPILGLVREKIGRLQRQPKQPQRGDRRNADERPGGIRADSPDVMLCPLVPRHR